MDPSIRFRWACASVDFVLIFNVLFLHCLGSATQRVLMVQQTVTFFFHLIWALLCVRYFSIGQRLNLINSKNRMQALRRKNIVCFSLGFQNWIGSLTIIYILLVVVASFSMNLSNCLLCRTHFVWIRLIVINDKKKKATSLANFRDALDFHWKRQNDDSEKFR